MGRDFTKADLMALAATKYEHIVLDENGVPVIAGANTKVVELAEEQYAYGWSPVEMHLQHPHLSLGQIHSALAYYWDHQEAIDADMERRFQDAEQMRRAAGDSPLQRRLRSLPHRG
jgi:uncharacterized protein (DUF433 family)